MFKIIRFNLIFLIILFLSKTAQSASSELNSKLNSELNSKLSSEVSPELDSELSMEELIQLSHAKELMGKYYEKSIVKNALSLEAKNKFVHEWTELSLKGKWKKQAKKISKAILYMSKKYELDPLFLLAVIQGESGFNPSIVGKFGEHGLMQIKPSTGRWIAGKEGFTWRGKNTLFDPLMNIKIGAAYFYYLREQFNSHSRLYLAAYNMGATNVKKALGKKVWPKEYPIHVMHYYIQLYQELSARAELKEMAQTVLARLEKR